MCEYLQVPQVILRRETAAQDALMVGYDYVDEEAARHAGVRYIDQQHLLGVEQLDPGFNEESVGERVLEPGSGAHAKVQAPGSFAAEKKSKAKDLPVPRSPAGRPSDRESV